MMRRLAGLVGLLVVTPAHSVVTYTKDAKPIFDQHCVECHESLVHDPNLLSFPFETEKFLAQSQIVDRVLERVTAQSMPPGNRPKLNQQEISILQQWRADGLQK